MANKLLIALSAQGATVADWRGGRIADCRAFGDDDNGRAAYRDHLTHFSGVPVHFVVDAVEEDYRFESLPHVSGGDRAELVARKLKQHYRNSPYISAVLLGRETEKRRDDRYLFTALTNADLIADWLQPVVELDLPVAGIYLLPMVSEQLMEKLGTGAANQLLVSQHPTGLRLTFFRDRRFRLSRLTRGESARADNRVRYFTEEISNTRLYLHALRTLTLDEPLTVLLVDQHDELAEVAAGISRENPSLECLALGRADLMKRLGVAESALDATPYAAHLHQLGLQAPRSNLAPAAVMAGYKRHQARRAIYAGCGVVAAVAAIWAGANLYQAMVLREETADAARRTAQYVAQYQEITRQFPQAPASADNLRKAVEVAQKLRESGRSPQRMMALVSRIAEATPTVVIQEFGWKYGTTEIETEGGARSVGADKPLPTTPGGAPAQLRRESALVEGEIRPFRGDYRGAIETINGFAGRIGAAPEVAEVRIIKLPLNVSPTLPLTGNTLDNPEQSASAVAEFRLLILFKPDA
jgi:hypothetical protein